MAIALNFTSKSIAKSQVFFPRLQRSGRRGRPFYCSMARTVRVGAVQMTSTNNPDVNYDICSRLVKEAAADGVILLCFPENFSFVSSREGESLKVAEPIDGPIMEKYCSLARYQVNSQESGIWDLLSFGKNVGVIIPSPRGIIAFIDFLRGSTSFKESKIWLSLGGFQEKGPDDTHLHNTHVLVDDSGNIRKTYRKIHLFDVNLPGNLVYKEGNFTTAGTEVVVEDSPAGRLGLTVCYDLRFPELYQLLRFEHNAQVLLVPSAFTKVTGEAHWEILLRSRAIETQCFIIAAAQTGKHNEKRESYGDSLIIDPWGTILSRLPDRLSTGIAIADIDLSKIDGIRTRMPIDRHRKFNVSWKSESL